MGLALCDAWQQADSTSSQPHTFQDPPPSTRCTHEPPRRDHPCCTQPPHTLPL